MQGFSTGVLSPRLGSATDLANDLGKSTIRYYLHPQGLVIGFFLFFSRLRVYVGSERVPLGVLRLSQKLASRGWHREVG
jgi:hypothetical protein